MSKKIADKTFSELQAERKHHDKNVHILKNLITTVTNDVEMKPQKWLWDNYIPIETCTLFAGPGGIGKSTLLLYIASLVSRGATFTLNSIEYSMPKGKILLFSAEDSIESSIVPRLKAVDADLSQIEIVESVNDSSHKDIERFFDLNTDLYLIEDKLKNDRDIKLIIFDPITAYIGDMKDNRANPVRNLLLKLTKLAKKYEIAIVLNTHTRKKSQGSEGGGSATDEVMGSSAWTNTVRKVFSITTHPDDDKLILFHNPKSNCGPTSEPLHYRIESCDVESGGIVFPTSKISWQAGKVTITANEAINPHQYNEKLETQRAMDFILEQLRFGSRSKDQIHKEAIDEGISTRTLYRAKEMLTKLGTKIISEKSHHDARKTIWYIGT